jgi:hypothetical protein
MFPMITVSVQNATQRFSINESNILPSKQIALYGAADCAVKRVDLFDNTNPVRRIDERLNRLMK